MSVIVVRPVAPAKVVVRRGPRAPASSFNLAELADTGGLAGAVEGDGILHAGGAWVRVPLATVADLGVLADTVAGQGVELADTTAGLAELTATVAGLDASIDQNDVVYISVAQTITAPKTLAAQAPTDTPLTIRVAVAATADAQRWQDSAGAALSRINAAGGLVLATTVGGVSAGNSWLLSASTTNNLLVANAPTNIVLATRAAASGTGDLQRWQDSAGATQSAMSVTGTLFSGASDGYRFDPVNRRARLGADVLGGAYGFLINHQVNARPNLVLYANPTQTADVLDVYDTGGTLSLQVLPSGTVFTPGRVATAGDLSAQLQATSTSTTRVGLIIRAAASQTANVGEWQDSTGAVKSKVSSTGTVWTIPQIATTTGTGIMFFDNANTVLVAGTSTTSAPFAVRAAASATADIQQWQTSGATVRSVVDSTGRVAVLTTAPVSGAPLTVFSSGSANPQILSRASASQTGNPQEWQDSTGALLARIDAAGNVRTTAGLAADAVGQSVIQWETATKSVVVKGSTGSLPLIVRLPAAPTANAQEWQDSGAVALAAITAAGRLNVPTVGSLTAGKATLETNYDTGSIGVAANAAGNKGLVVRLAASPTANAQEWQDSAGTILTRVDAAGRITSAGGGSWLLSKTSPNWQAVAENGAHVVLVLAGAGGQTGDLQQWRNSAGTALRSVTAAGLPRWAVAANVQTTVGAAGGANALPATPTKYLKVVDDAGTTLVVPAYAAA